MTTMQAFPAATSANAANTGVKFGKYRDGTRRPFPQIRSVGLGECGTHAQLLRLGGLYERLYERQRGLEAVLPVDLEA